MVATGRARSRASLVPRRRLVSPLVGSDRTAVVLIHAPAGFGKSTVLSEWSRADRRPFAPVSLADHHDDPVLLTASIAAAIGDVAPVDESVYLALHGSQPGTLAVAVPRLLDSLNRWDGSLVVALDDVHALTAPASLSVVEAIAQGLPSGSQLALASRTQPPIHVGRLRANRDLLEVTAHDLAMKASEATAMLRACGLRLQPASVEVLVERTEGWPAALYLAALSLGSADDADQAALRFGGDDRMISEYLRDEFVTKLTADELSFLTRTSVLDEVSGELCDAVLGTEGSARTLRALARANALVEALDSKDRWFRYHALLRQMLESDLHALDPHEEAELHAGASRWYAERGDFDRAVPHAIATGDVEAAGDLIWSQTAQYTSAGREATLERWLSRFTEPQIAATPSLCLVRAAHRLGQGDGAAVEHWTTVALELLEASSREDAEAMAVSASAIRASGAAREGVIRMREDAAAAYELLPADNPWRSLCRFIEGTSHHLTGDREQARLALEEGARRGAATAPQVESLCLSQLALLALEEDDPEAALRLAEESVAKADLYGLNDYPTCGLVFAVAGLVRAGQGRPAEAAKDVDHAIDLLGGLTDLSPWYETETRIALARALVVLDDAAAARAQLAEAGRRLRGTPDAPVLREWIALAWKEADAANAVTGRWPLSPMELRLLHYLPTHLTFREIADEVFVSTNTVKTQARSIYQKLGVSSRAEAVDCARTAGLLDPNDAPGTRATD